MAKKPKKAEAESEAPAEDEAGPPKKRRKLFVMGSLAALLALGGGGAFFFLGGRGQPEEAKAAPVKPVSFIDIREMTINLARGPKDDRSPYLKLKVALELSDPALAATIQPLMPRIEDAFQVYVRELRPSDLEGSAGVYRLKEELLRRVNMAVYPSRIDAVLFKEIVVQ